LISSATSPQPAGGGAGSVVAGDPHEPRAAGQALDLAMLGLRQARDGLPVVEGIAQADHRRGGKRIDQGRQHRQRLARVVARQQLARRHGIG